MRIAVVTLGLIALISAVPAAQAPEKLVVTPAAPFRPRLDFGLEQAQKNLPQGPWRVVKAPPKHALPMQPSLPESLVPPIDCEMIRKHHHELLAPTMRTIAPPATKHHQLKTLPITPCPIR